MTVPAAGATTGRAVRRGDIDAFVRACAVQDRVEPGERELTREPPRVGMIEGVADIRALFLDNVVETAAKLAESALACSIRVSTSSGSCATAVVAVSESGSPANSRISRCACQ